MLGNIKKSTFALLLILALFIISCESATEEIRKETDIEILTGSVIENSMQSSDMEESILGCEYENGSVCESGCCYFHSECGSFRKCDLENNEWLEADYSDSECSDECKYKETVPKEEITEEDKEKTRELIEGFMESIEQKETKTCTEGWICANSTWRAYIMADCTLFGQVKCDSGCLNSKCTIACDKGEKKCKGSRVIACESGNEWETFENCENGCDDGKCINDIDIIEFQNTSQETQNNESSEQNQSNENEQNSAQNCDSGCINITTEESNFAGAVKCNPPAFEEYVAFKNECDWNCNLEGWILSDAQDTKFTFPEFILSAESSVRITTGQGMNSSTNIFWSRCIGIWNNAGDTVYLKDNENNLIVEYTYP